LKPFLSSVVIVMCLAILAPGAVGPDTAQKLYDRVSPSLVAVQYTWESELGRREVIGSGVVVGDEGLVVASLAVFYTAIPDEQMKDFKIIVPKVDEEEQELDAIFVGRDERTNLAFLKTKEPQKWKAIKFEQQPVKVGQTILSVGLMPKAAGYHSYFTESTVSASLRGEVPMVMVSGGLATVGSPVFSDDGKAIGLVSLQTEQQVLLNDQRNPLAALTNPPLFFVQTKDFIQSLEDPPVAGVPMKLPWIGVPQLTGLKKEVAEYYGLKNQPAVQVGDVIPNTPAEKSGLKQGTIIVKMNGKPLERGDEPEEIPAILRRKLMRLKVGDQVTFSVLTEKDKPLKEISITLEEQPHRANVAKRYFAEDLGFSVREIVFYDTYVRKLPAESKGVVIALIKPQSSAASAHLANNDLVTEINGKPVTDLEQFKQEYQVFRKEKPKEAVVLVVLREGKTTVIRVEPPQ
jgi:serine protease Do